MAHRGKPWPLTFRRDFNLNVNTYRAGLAHDYLLQTHQFMFTDWPLLRNLDWHCGPATDAVLPRLIWRSEMRTISGHTWRFRLVGTLVGDPLQLFEPSWYLERDGSDVCAWLMADATSNSRFPPSGVQGRIIFFDPVVFPSGPGSIGLITVAAIGYP